MKVINPFIFKKSFTSNQVQIKNNLHAISKNNAYAKIIKRQCFVKITKTIFFFFNQWRI